MFIPVPGTTVYTADDLTADGDTLARVNNTAQTTVAQANSPAPSTTDMGPNRSQRCRTSLLQLGDELDMETVIIKSLRL